MNLPPNINTDAIMQALRDYPGRSGALEHITLESIRIWDGTDRTAVQFLCIEDGQTVCYDAHVNPVGWMDAEEARLLVWACGRVSLSCLFAQLDARRLEASA